MLSSSLLIALAGLTASSPILEQGIAGLVNSSSAVDQPSTLESSAPRVTGSHGIFNRVTYLYQRQVANITSELSSSFSAASNMSTSSPSSGPVMSTTASSSTIASTATLSGTTTTASPGFICPDNNGQTASNSYGESYKVQCGTSDDSPDILQTTKNRVTDDVNCVDRCSIWNEQNESPKCVQAIYHEPSNDCVLKSTIGNLIPNEYDDRLLLVSSPFITSTSSFVSSSTVTTSLSSSSVAVSSTMTETVTSSTVTTSPSSSSTAVSSTTTVTVTSSSSSVSSYSSSTTASFTKTVTVTLSPSSPAGDATSTVPSSTPSPTNNCSKSFLEPETLPHRSINRT